MAWGRDRKQRGIPRLVGELEFKKPTFEPLGQRGVKKRIAEARKLGEKHGKLGVPGPDHRQAFAVSALKDDAEGLLSQIARDWHEVNRILKGEWCRLRRVTAEVEKQLPARQEAVKKAEKRVNDKQRLYDKRRADADSEAAVARHRIGRIPYVLGLIAVFLVDVPLNAVVFQIFGSSQLATWLLAGLLGILVLPAAHLLGIQSRNRFPDRIITSVALVIPLLLIIAIAIMRVSYLEENHQRVPAGGWGVPIFLAFNLAVFGSAIFLSYLRHDPFEQALEEAAEEVAKAKNEHEKALGELVEIESQLLALRGRIAELRAWGEEELAKAKSWVAGERNFFEQLMNEYRMANQAARSRPQDVIEALGNIEKPTVPPELADATKLSWSCEEADDLADASVASAS